MESVLKECCDLLVSEVLREDIEKEACLASLMRFSIVAFEGNRPKFQCESVKIVQEGIRKNLVNA